MRGLAVFFSMAMCMACQHTVPVVHCAAPVDPLRMDTQHPLPPLNGGVWGQLDPNLLMRVQSLNLVDHLKIGVAADGRIGELSIYHNDPAPIPKPVRDLLRQEFPQHHLLTYETEWEDAPITEATVRTAQGRICELSATNDGAVRYIECLMEPSDLPPPVAAAAQRVVLNAQVLEAEVRNDGTGTYYKVKLRDGTQIHQVRFNPEGQVIAHYLEIRATLLLAQ